MRDLLNSRGLLAFAGAAILFRLADISMLPLGSEGLGSRRGRLGAIFMAGTIIIPSSSSPSQHLGSVIMPSNGVASRSY